MTIAPLRLWLRRGGIARSSMMTSIALALISSLMGFGLIVGSGVLLVKASSAHSLVVLAGLLIGVELVAFLRAPVRFEERIASHRRAVFATVQLRLWLFDEITRRIPGSLATVASGHLLDASMEDLETMEGLQVSTIGPLLSSATSAIIAIVAVCVLDPLAGLYTAVGAALLVLIIGSCLVPLSQLVRAEKAARTHSATATSDLFGGLVELTMAGMDTVAIEAIEAAELRLSQAAQRSSKMVATVTLSAGVVIAATTGFVMRHLGTAPHLSAVRSVAIVLFVLAGLEAILAALPAVAHWSSVAVAASRLSLISEAHASPAFNGPGVAWPKGDQTLVVSDLHLATHHDGPDILHGASFSLPANSLNALRGPSGAGKTTLAAAIMGLIDVQAGTISLGGLDLAAMAPETRWHHISLVDQHPVLFGATLADTLRSAKPKASDTELLDALRSAGLASLAEPAKLAIPAGEGGAAFSGGELRRIAIARALLRAPQILILDEPTVGLDAEEASSLLSTIAGLSNATSVLIITHEPELPIAVDQDLWLDDGIVTTING